MAIKELFQDSRPQVLFDPRASQRIDPRFKFTRDATAFYVDRDGALRLAQKNEPRLAYDISTKEYLGLLLETTAVNEYPFSTDLSQSNYGTITPSSPIYSSPLGPNTASLAVPTAVEIQHNFGRSDVGVTQAIHTASIYAKAAGYNYIGFNSVSGGYPNDLVIFDLNAGTVFSDSDNSTGAYIESLPDGWYRCVVPSGIPYTGTSTCIIAWYPISNAANGFAAFTGDGSSGVYVAGAQFEIGPIATSYIPNNTLSTTRPADLISIEGTTLPSTGSIYIDARSLTSDVDDTLLSAANGTGPAGNKLTLAIREPASLYNSKALVYEVDGAFKPTLPFPVPTNARERNLITYGANNYHYRSDSARYTPSSSTSVPANMTRLGIGHDVTDPTMAFNGYINTVYLWPGEITPTVAEALVRGDLDPKDADGGVFTPETGALAFVFNTQGTAADGNTVVQLPLGGSTNNVLVDWGDNTSSSLIGAAASVTVNHTYPAAGIYPVQITADDDGTNSGLENLQFYDNSPADLVRVLQWGGTTTWQPTTMYRAFRDCTQLDFENAARINLPDTSAITDWREAFYNCSSLSGVYPNFDHSAATDLSYAWYNCSSITTFSSSLDDLSLVTNYRFAWYGCSSITSFPTITIPTDQGAVNLGNAWQDCTNLQSFPAGINTAAVTSMSSTWNGCSSLESFPLLNTAAVTTMQNAWNGCSSLDNIVNAGEATSFPLINTSNVTNLASAWANCSSLTGFPLIDTSKCTSFFRSWRQCTSLASFPAIDTSLGTSFTLAWEDNAFSTFPALNFSSATVMGRAWNGCSNLTAFPALSAAQRFSSEMVDGSGPYGGFRSTWANCTSLTTFPPNIFDDVANCVEFGGAFGNCALTAQSIENILVSINTANTSNGTLDLDGGTNANTSTWSAAANAAYIALVGRGWTITQNGTAPS